MTGKKVVELFYDVISPYSWFAFEVMVRYQSRWNINLKLRPFFLSGIIQSSGNEFPEMVSNKGMYIMQDIQRCAQYFEVPLVIPKNFVDMMFEDYSLKAQRFLTSVDMMCPEMVEAVSRELWILGWSLESGLSKDASIVKAAQKAGLSHQDVQELLCRAKHLEVKNRLNRTTDEAIELGAFESPLMVADVNSKKECVFGSDRFPILAEILGVKWEGPNPGKC